MVYEKLINLSAIFGAICAELCALAQCEDRASGPWTMEASPGAFCKSVSVLCIEKIEGFRCPVV